MPYNVFRFISIEELAGIDMLLIRQARHVHTDHHDSRVKVSAYDFRAKVVVVSTTGFGVDSDTKDSLDRDVSITRLSILLSRRQNPLLRPVITSKMRCLGSGQTTSRLFSSARCCRRAFGLPPNAYCRRRLGIVTSTVRIKQLRGSATRCC